MATASFDGAFFGGQAADFVFKTSTLRRNLYRSEGVQPSRGFVKPALPALRAAPAGQRHQREGSRSQQLQPFHASEGEGGPVRRPSPKGSRRETRRLCERQKDDALLDNGRQASTIWTLYGSASTSVDRRRAPAGGAAIWAPTADELGTALPESARHDIHASVSSSTSSVTARRGCRHLDDEDDWEDDGQDSLFVFSEEPDDSRVLLPAHRMGDLLPAEGSVPPRAPPRQQRSARQLNVSRSSPAVFIAVKKAPLHASQRPSGGSRADSGFADGDAPRRLA